MTSGKYTFTGGARTRQELYLDELPVQWAREYAHIHYHTALSGVEAAQEVDGFSGFIHGAVLKNHDDLSSFDVYMSGPPAMIDTAKHAFLQRGVPERRLYFDSFEFGLDVPVRVLARPH